MLQCKQCTFYKITIVDRKRGFWLMPKFERFEIVRFHETAISPVCFEISK